MATYCQFPKSTLKHSFLYSILRIRTLITRKKKSLKETRLKRNYLTPLHRDSDRRHRWSSIAAERHEHAPATVDPQSVDDEAKHHSTLLAERSYSFREKKKTNPENPKRKEKNQENPKRKKRKIFRKFKQKKRKKSRKSKMKKKQEIQKEKIQKIQKEKNPENPKRKEIKKIQKEKSNKSRSKRWTTTQ